MTERNPSNIAVFLTSAFMLFFLPALVNAFPIPERLEFEISYSGIPAGRAVQEVKQVGDEILIVSTAKSADWLKFFFPVDDRIESILVSGAPPHHIGVPRLYRERIREGWTRFQKDAVFDRKNQEVTTKDFLKKCETTAKITDRTYDTLSSFFYFRSIPLQVGASHFIEIFDCKKLWNTEVQVLRREELVTPLGRFKTVVIKPVLKFEGIFARTGDMFIWLTDDERRIPVQMKSKVRIGSITATLTGGSYWPDKK
ncbi:MAG: hypothetical protein A2X82_02965 [Geobacteraceae bacterium GWC2_55_20]|nr:MAG: hypothetical protein A2X82_02965 [Geobacteraceae bacterium GWC2_55_20]OGU19593.1 MAG: hypothetical protein A2X85_08470 [Geobacteraceae bacterium GWF2_54_21]HBA71327.1 DUF3108 domain-containing protein [Geobacter sp.]HCE68733.1 DUF3108 domain-containing protein [Geobacter sp.]